MPKLRNSKIASPPRHDPSRFSKKELYTALSVLISDEELDNKALMIVPTLKDNNKMLYIALSKHLSSQNHEKLSKIQSKLLDTAEEQNLKKLKYDDNAIHRRNTFLLWIKQLKTVLACHHQLSSFTRPSGRISSLPKDKPKLNHPYINQLLCGRTLEIYHHPPQSPR
jgi:hypothetical protein